MISATVLRFHARPEVGPRIDQLKFRRLVDGPSLKRWSIQRSRSLVQKNLSVSRIGISQTKEMTRDRLSSIGLRRRG